MGSTAGEMAQGGMTGQDSGSLSMASALSGISPILGAAGTMFDAFGKRAADDYQSDTLKLAAQEGEVKALQTNAQLTQRLNMTLGNIDAVRAASHTDPSSPTGAAVRGMVEATSTNQKNIEVDRILAQSQLDESQAAYLRQAGSVALLSGGVNAVAGLAKAASGVPGLQG